MEQKIKTWAGTAIIAIVAVTAISLTYVSYLKNPISEESFHVKKTKRLTEQNMQMANPASVFCEKNGGKSEIINAPDGSQSGICIFPDGSQCEEWKFFRGECKAGVNQDKAGVIYTNSNYGFQITLPGNWNGYVPVVNTKTNDKNVEAYLYIDLPTSEKTWPGDTDPKTGKSMLGYASMFAITIWNTENFDEVVAQCKKDPNPGCPNDSHLAKNDKYIFDITGPQAMPGDLIKSIPTDYIKTIGQSFRLIQ